ncbi:MAG: 2-oxo acid dehydrogenase subunit E2 [Solirubrobacterales bacterium]|nr:2-oxo acid dehydrogenase subunit E2 [Solirubrobacterales bacterium]
MAESPTAGVKGEMAVAEPSAAQRTVARRTAESRATIPHVEMSIEVEMAAAVERLEPERCSLTAVLVRACALALRTVPRANAAYRDGRFELYSRVNVGVVVAEEDVYVIPTVFDADQKSLEDLSAELAELATAARERRLAPPAFSGATFTLWDAGAHGLSSASMVINPPQAAALAAGQVRPVVVARSGSLAEAKLMTVTLAGDHRILYGAHAVRFLDAVRAYLEAPDGGR